MAPSLSQPVMIERATLNDLDAIVAIENCSFPFPWSRNLLKAEINGKEFSFVYVLRLVQPSPSAGTLVGYIYFWLAADEVHILDIAVDPNYRRFGYGRQLLRFALDFGRERGACSAFLEVRASNLAARRFYETEGFEQIGVRKQYYSDNREDAHLLKKEWANAKPE